jgi:predicted nucleotidyltransferase
MWNWFKTFVSDYAPWTFVDWLIYTKSGHTFVMFFVLAIISAVGRLWAVANSVRHDLLVALLALSVATILIGLWELICWLFSLKRRASIVPLTSPQEQILHQATVNWLRRRLEYPNLKVQHCGLFGSILREHHSTSDVDLAVLIEQVSERRFRYIAREIRKHIAVEFKRQFGHRLQVQFFAAEETSRFHEFGQRDKYEVLF